MAGSALFVDVWDGDGLMHLGTLAVPLRELMRQQRGVVKTAMVRIVPERGDTQNPREGSARSLCMCYFDVEDATSFVS